MTKSAKRFRNIAIYEGFSYLAIFALGMPFKYLLGVPELNKIIGTAHGVLFILYIIFLFLAWRENKWSIKMCITLFIASLLPFGAFWADHYFFKKS